MPRASTRKSSAPCLPRGQGQPGIQNFARATKPGVPTASSPPGKSASAQLPESPSKKRKLGELENVECGRPNIAIGVGESGGRNGDGGLTPSKTLRIGELVVSTPRSGHYVSPSSPSKRERKTQTQLQRQREHTKQHRSRPSVFYDLLNLHSSFLKALTLHSAHNGVAAPADLRDFLRSIERIWKKRRVVAKDLQRLIWIWDLRADSNCTGHSYRLTNYGLGRVCLERVIRGGERVDENQLQGRFEEELELLWETRAEGEVDPDEEDEERGVAFTDMLGLSPIHESLTPFTSFRKGQQRLQDLKGGVIRWKTEKLRTESAEDDAAPKQVEAASTRRQGLWDRIKSKQLRQSKLPPPPSKEMLLRRAAAERVEEVAGVLALLRPAASMSCGRIATQRKPFRFDMIIQNVQDSARNPISTAQVDICLELLSRADVAGQWVNIVSVKEVKSVVLVSCVDVSLKEIGARVGQMRVGFDDEVRFG